MVAQASFWYPETRYQRDSTSTEREVDLAEPTRRPKASFSLQPSAPYPIQESAPAQRELLAIIR
jgi:hypothetical protein